MLISRKFLRTITTISSDFLASYNNVLCNVMILQFQVVHLSKGYEFTLTSTCNIFYGTHHTYDSMTLKVID